MKGQIFSIDVLVAFSIFFVTIFILVYTWLEISIIPSYELNEKAIEVADFMISLKMAQHNILDCSKLLDLSSQTYENLRKELNIGGYDFWIEIENMDSDVCPGADSDYGKIASDDVKNIATVTRIVKGQNKITKMNVRIYREG